MKNLFFILALFLPFMSNKLLAQQKKPISPKKTTTTVKTSPAKTTSKTTVISKPTTTSSINTSTTPSPKIEDKKTVKPATPNSQPAKGEVSEEQPNSTTVQQSSGPLKGNKLEEETAKETKSEKIKTTKIPIEGRTIKFGIRAEATQYYTLDVGSGIDFSPGVNIGLLVNLPISQQISIQPEVLYSIINTKVSLSDSNYVKSSIGNILVPLMFNFNFGKNTTKFMLNLGGYANYGMTQSTKVIQRGNTVKDGSIDLGNDRFDYGLGVGLGVKLNNKLIVEARSFYGMKDNINKNGFGTLGVGYLF